MTNNADRLARRSIAALFENRYDDWAETLDDNVLFDDRQASSSQTFFGKATVTTEFGRGAYGSLGPQRAVDVETVQCRGETLVLLRGTNTVAGAFTYDWLTIDRVTPAGLIDLIILFDSDSLNDAMAQLDLL